MYSKNQKATALELYHKINNVTETARRLGYPTREQLHKWINKENLPSKKRKPVELVNTPEHPRNPPAEVKLFILKRCFELGESVKLVSEETGYTRATIYQWRKRYLRKGAAGLVNRKNIQPGKLKSSENGKQDKEKSQEREISELRDLVFNMQMEIDILKETIKVIKKDKGINELVLSNKEKIAIIDALKQNYSLSDLLSKIDISKSSYYYQRKAVNYDDKYLFLRKSIKDLFKSSKSRYGYRRIHAQLRQKGITVSEKIVRRIMNDEELFVIIKKHKKYNSYKGEITPAVPNMINRNFKSDIPNQKWLTDITEFALPAGKVYLSPILDCFDGYLPSWEISVNPNADLVNKMLDKAIRKLKEDEHPIIHTDRGCHYRWPGWIERMDKAKLKRSMSRKGCYADNSACEGLFGRIKNEMFYNQNWQNVSINEFIKILNDYLVWYNNKRIKKSLGYMSPLSYRQSMNLDV